MDRTELMRPDHVPATQQGARARRLARALAALEPARVLRSPGTEPSFAAALGAFVWSASGNAFGGPDLLDGLRSLAVDRGGRAIRRERSGGGHRVATRARGTTRRRDPRRALMRILLVNDYATPTAGAERITRDLRDGLRARGHEVRVFASRAQLIAGRVVRRRGLLRHQHAAADADLDA